MSCGVDGCVSSRRCPVGASRTLSCYTYTIRRLASLFLLDYLYLRCQVAVIACLPQTARERARRGNWKERNNRNRNHTTRLDEITDLSSIHTHTAHSRFTPNILRLCRQSCVALLPGRPNTSSTPYFKSFPTLWTKPATTATSTREKGNLSDNTIASRPSCGQSASLVAFQLKMHGLSRLHLARNRSNPGEGSHNLSGVHGSSGAAKPTVFLDFSVF